jgi:hypothetical protein
MEESLMTKTLNTPVSVNAYYFSGRDMRTFPREIEYGGQAVTFASGLRYLVQKGGEAIRLFDMSSADGLTYRLKQTGSSWTLLATKGGY